MISQLKGAFIVKTDFDRDFDSAVKRSNTIAMLGCIGLGIWYLFVMGVVVFLCYSVYQYVFVK